MLEQLELQQRLQLAGATVVEEDKEALRPIPIPSVDHKPIPPDTDCMIMYFEEGRLRGQDTAVYLGTYFNVVTESPTARFRLKVGDSEDERYDLIVDLSRTNYGRTFAAINPPQIEDHREN